MEAMIFAAGLGTRLRPLTNEIPKAMVSVCGTPLIGHAILNLKQQGVNRFVVNVHHFASKITDYLKSENNFGVDIHISDEINNLLDTGGGLLKAKPLFRGNGPIVVCNVDILTNLNIGQMLKVHMNSNAIATLAVRNRTTSRYLLLNNRQNLVGWKNTKTGEIKMSRRALAPSPVAFSGFHIIQPQFFENIRQSGRFSIVETYLDVAKQHKIKGYLHNDDYWFDVGKHDTLKQANKWIVERKPEYLRFKI